MLSVNDTVAIIIDVQERLIDHMHNADQVKANAARLIEGCRILGVPVAVTEQYPKGLGSTIEELRTLFDDCVLFEKQVFSCWAQDDFRRWLVNGGCNNVLLAGIETHVCVSQTAVDLLDSGFHVEVVADAVSSRREENREIGLSKMQRRGADLTSTEMALFELLRVAKGDKFKAVSRLVR